jgi:hypothetical protein
MHKHGCGWFSRNSLAEEVDSALQKKVPADLIRAYGRLESACQEIGTIVRGGVNDEHD